MDLQWLRGLIWDHTLGWPHQELPSLPSSSPRPTITEKTNHEMHLYSFGSLNLQGISRHKSLGLLPKLPHPRRHRPHPRTRIPILVQIGGREDVGEGPRDEELVEGRLEEGTDVGLGTSSLHCPCASDFFPLINSIEVHV